MIKRLTLATGLAAGYVLGAKAGRERYEQIIKQVNELRNRTSERVLDGTTYQTHGDIDLTGTTDTVQTMVGDPA
ncbi:MAG: hypothetical protein JWN31_810 [Frankiales bacterium]|nr:hypothetical protein [Frankiales bacterium]